MKVIREHREIGIPEGAHEKFCPHWHRVTILGLLLRWVGQEEGYRKTEIVAVVADTECPQHEEFREEEVIAAGYEYQPID